MSTIFLIIYYIGTIVSATLCTYDIRKHSATYNDLSNIICGFVILTLSSWLYVAYYTLNKSQK